MTAAPLTRRRPWSHRLGPLPALDGARALGLVSIVVFHLRPEALPGGAVGVQFFFALSGFLITSLLLDEVATTGRVSLGKFLGRRAVRLLPALALVAAAAVWFEHYALGAFGDTTRAVPAILTYRANDRLISEGLGGLGILTHTWSLSVEGQFYLLWPLVVAAVLVALRRSPRALTLVCVLGMVPPALLREHLHSAGVLGYRLLDATDVNLDRLLVGCALAAALRVPEWRRGLVAGLRLLALPAGVFLLVVALTAFGNRDTVEVALGTPVALACGTFVGGLAVGPATGPLQRLMSVPVLRWLGKLSYGFYLWHYPILLGLRQQSVDPTTILWLTPVLTLLAGTLSWHLVERPTSRALRDRLAPTPPRRLPRRALSTAELAELVGASRGDQR